MDLHVGVWMLRREIRQSRQQPLCKEESERRHSQWPGAAVGPCLVDCTLQIGERLLNFRPQQRRYRSQLGWSRRRAALSLQRSL